MRTIEAITLALLVCGAALGHSRAIQTLLTNRPMLWLGQISYSVYIWQQPFFFAHGRSPFLSQPVAELLKIPVVLAVAHLSYTYVERPIIRSARHMLRVRQQQEAA